MINLLPPDEKKRLLLKKKERIITIFLALGLFFIFCFSLVLISFKAYLDIEAKSEKILLETAIKKFNQPKITGLKKKVKSANLELKNLNSFYGKKIYFSDILENISNIIPEEIYLNKLSISLLPDNEKEKLVMVSLSGFSPTREILFAFRKKLEDSSRFREIYSPPSDWIKPTNINFFLKFEMSNK